MLGFGLGRRGGWVCLLPLAELKFLSGRRGGWFHCLLLDLGFGLAGGGWVALLLLTGLVFWSIRGWLIPLPFAGLGFWSGMRGWLGCSVAFGWVGALV